MIEGIMENKSELKLIAKKSLNYAIGLTLLSITTNVVSYELTKFNILKTEKKKGIYYAIMDCESKLNNCRNHTVLLKYFGGGIGLREASEECLEYYKEFLKNPFKVV